MLHVIVMSHFQNFHLAQFFELFLSFMFLTVGFFLNF